LLIRDVLQPFDKALILLDLNADTSTPTGKMVLTAMLGVAELGRALITERTQTGRKNKAAKGGYVYGSPAFGMMLNKAAVFSSPSIEREPPQTFRLVKASLRFLSARLLSGGTSGSSKKYHHCSLFFLRWICGQFPYT
jgi:DNA invertase Pin-like site-specific DNA recombinase